MDLDANDLASMADTIYHASEYSSTSSSDSNSETPLVDPFEEDSEEDYHDSKPMAPPDDMVMELHEEDPDPVMKMPICQILPLYHFLLLESNNRP